MCYYIYSSSLCVDVSRLCRSIVPVGAPVLGFHFARLSDSGRLLSSHYIQYRLIMWRLGRQVLQRSSRYTP